MVHVLKNWAAANLPLFVTFGDYKNGDLPWEHHRKDATRADHRSTDVDVLHQLMHGDLFDSKTGKLVVLNIFSIEKITRLTFVGKLFLKIQHVKSERSSQVGPIKFMNFNIAVTHTPTHARTTLSLLLTGSTHASYIRTLSDHAHTHSHSHSHSLSYKRTLSLAFSKCSLIHTRPHF